MNDLTPPSAPIADTRISTETVAPGEDAAATHEVALVEPAHVPVVRSQGEEIRSAILEFARDKDFDVEKLRALTDLQNSVEDRQARQAANMAFIRLQRRMPLIKKNGRLEYPKDKNKPDGERYLVTKFAKWEDIQAAIDPIIQEEGFALTYGIEPRADGGGLLVHAILLHESGHERHGPTIPVPLDTSGGKNNAQAYGSSVSYGQRYAAKALLNLRFEGDDDDGVRGGMTFVTPAQVKEITDLVNETETDPRAFLEWIFADEEPHNYGEIPAEKFVGVVNALKSKQRRMKMEGDNGKAA